MTIGIDAPLAFATAPPRGPARWRAWVTPAVHAVLVGGLILSTAPMEPERMASASALTGFMAAAALASLIAIVLARRHPWWATLLPLAPFAMLPWTGWFVWGWFAALVSVASIAALDGLRRALVPTAAALGVALVYCGTTVPALLPIGPVTSGRQGDGGTPPPWLGLDDRTGVTFAFYAVAILAVVAVSWAIGTVQRSRAAKVAAQLSAHRALEVESAAAERAHLARDLHDVVAHHVSLVAVRAESAPYQHPDLDPQAREVLAAIADDARAALGELRQVLGVLQRSQDAAADRAPQPGAEDVEALVADARSAGQQVEATGEWPTIAAAPGYVLYRAVQEGLSNARRHAPGAEVVLERWASADAVGIRLSNVSAADAIPGRGLIGMRERVEALGGTMTARAGDGRFALDVALPSRADGGSR